MKLSPLILTSIVLTLSNPFTIAHADTSGHVTKEPVTKKPVQEKFEGIKVTKETVTPTGDRFRQSNEAQVIKESYTPISKEPAKKPSFPYSEHK